MKSRDKRAVPARIYPWHASPDVFRVDPVLDQRQFLPAGVDNAFTCGSCRHDFSHVRITFRHNSPSTWDLTCSYFSRNFLMCQSRVRLKVRTSKCLCGDTSEAFVARKQKLAPLFLHGTPSWNRNKSLWTVRIGAYACREFPAKDPSVFSSTFARWVPTSEVEHTV